MKKFYVLPLILLLWAQTTNAQYTKLLDFTGSSGPYIGRLPYSGGLLSDHVYLYGVTAGGGLYNAGTIYKIEIADGSFTNLYNFKGADGAGPRCTPVSDGVYLYGTTLRGGLYNKGTIYKLKISDNSLTVLHHFNGADGLFPQSSLIIVDGYLYGMTRYGGNFNNGSVFKLKIADNSFTKIYDLDQSSGYATESSFISDGTYLYGTAAYGGENSDGTIFKIKIADGSLTVMHNFSWDDGAYPFGSLISDGTYLYGVTVDGGPLDYGTIFKIKITDNSFTELHEFNGNEGSYPWGDLVSDGTYLYGLASSGGVNDKGTIFKMKIADNSVIKLHDFSGIDGEDPDGSLTIEGSNLYGVTSEGGIGGNGVVFKYQYLTIHPDANGTLYVDSAAAPGGDGSSWATALPQLSDALKAAQEVNTAVPGMVKQIWMTSGTYYPLYTPEAGMTERDKTFMLVKNVFVSGGFAGTETDATQRTPVNGKGTILSGDIGVRGNTSDNAYHVITAIGDVGDDVLFDGYGLLNVTVTGGNANGTSSAVIKGRTIWRNQGGGIESDLAKLMIINCLFRGNNAVNGAAILTANGPGFSFIINCTFADNTDIQGKAIYCFNTSSQFHISNSIITDGIRYDGPPPVIHYSLVQGMPADITNHNLDGSVNPGFKNPLTGDYSLASFSPLINTGNNEITTVAGQNSLDLSGYPRIYDAANGGIVDMGAYELQRNPVKLDAKGIMYVDSAAAPGGDGSSWATALPQLSDALKAAQEFNTSVPGIVKEIWMTSGTYYPLYTPEAGMTERDKTFMLAKNVTVSGGFAGTETDATQRTPVNGKGTILSGDIGVRGNTSDNAYHVVTAIGDIEDLLSEGYGLINVTVTGGNANGTSSAVIKGRTIGRNQGGGIESDLGNLLLVGCLFQGNSAVNGAAIAANVPGFGAIINCTFADNADIQGKAIYCFNTSTQFEIYNSIITDGIRYDGPPPVIHYSLVQGMPADITNHNLDGSVNPGFKNPLTGDYRLTSFSPLINTGDNEMTIVLGQKTLDLSGYPRIYDAANGGIVDMGAYELQRNPVHADANGILYVDSAAVPGGDGSSWATAVPKLSDALHYARIHAANWASDNLRIYVAKGTYLPEYRADNNIRAINDRNTAFVMVKNVQLFGGFPSGGGVRNPSVNPTVLSGDIGTVNDAADNAYHVVISAGDAGNALLDGFTITKGNANGTVSIMVNGLPVWDSQGGGIENDASSPALTNLIISGNTASLGGGILNDNSSPALTNVTLSGNSAGSSGGGMYNASTSSPELTNVTLSGNSAGSSGGGMYNLASNLKIDNSILFGNTAPEGNNIYNSGGAATFKYSLVEGSGDWNNSWNSSWGTDGGNNVITLTNSFIDAPAGNYQLIVSSPALNGGSNTLYTDAGGDLANDMDLAGNARVYNLAGGGIIDMGAFERQRNPVQPDANGILYVDSAAAPGGDGSSWATALPQLSDALKAAQEINLARGLVAQIWMTSGTYYPLYTPEANMTERDKTFMLVQGVAILGGFAGTESSIDQRAPVTGRGTILSGDIGVHGNTSDNAYHVVTAIGKNDSHYNFFSLSNITITGGNANGTSSAVIKGRTIWRNQGGGIESDLANLKIINCLFVKNSAVNGAAIMTAHGSDVNAIINCTFADNTDNQGKAIYCFNTSSQFYISNSIITDGIRYDGPPPAIHYSLVEGMPADITNHNLDGSANPRFKNPLTGDYSLASFSPLINKGDNEMTTEAGQNSLDLSGYPRIYDAANGGIVDIGAYEYQDAHMIPDANGIMYVDSAAAPGGDGSSWQKALQYLSTALHAADADSVAKNIKTIYVAKGTYYPTGVQSGVNRDSAFIVFRGDIKIYGGYPNGGGTRNITANTTRLSGNIGNSLVSTDNSYHVLVIAGLSESADSVVVDGLTFSGGYTSSTANSSAIYNDITVPRTAGGGAYTGYNTTTRLAFRNCTFSGNTANASIGGAGIYNTFSNPLLSNCSFLNNVANGSGGGMFNVSASPTLLNCGFLSNTAEGSGGGMYNMDSSNPIITNCSFSGNLADGSGGGGMFNNGSSPKITDCTFSDNIAGNTQSLRGSGGGMYNLGASNPVITNSSFSDNLADGRGGGGIFNSKSSPELTNVTLSGNSSRKGGGMYNLTSNPKINNSILFGNTASEGNNIYSSTGSAATFKYSLIEGSGGWNRTWGTDGGNNIITSANSFVDAAAGNYQLIVSSPAVNAGSNTLYTEAGGNLAEDTDLAGKIRIFGAAIDMGAYENQDTQITPDANGIMYVDSAAAPGGDGSSWEEALQSFGTAIHAGDSINKSMPIAADSVRQIWVANGTYQPAPGTSFFMLPKVKIYGGFAGGESSLANRNLNSGDTSILLGNSNSVIRNDNNGLDTSAVLDGFKITGGGGAGVPGGGIHNIAASPALSHLTISGNMTGDNGGGMANVRSSSPVLTNVTISGNTTDDSGGGMANVQSSSPVLTNVTIIGNTAVVGGGMDNNRSWPVLTNVIISGNTAAVYGGGMSNDNSSSAVLANVTISSNMSGSKGGGIFNENSSSFTLTNSILWGNTAPKGKEIYNGLGCTTLLYHSLYGNGNGDVFTDVYSVFIASDTLTVAPRFVDIANGNYQLQSSSPAINAGINDSIPTWDSTDVAGNSRIYDLANGGVVDMGAYEFQGSCPPIVIATQPADQTVCDDTDAIFNVEVEAGAGTLSYRWQVSSDGENFTNLTGVAPYSGIDGPTLTITDTDSTLNGLLYRAIVSNECLSDTSQVAQLLITQITIAGIPAEAKVGVDYNFTFSASGGIAPYTWSLLEGELPNGLILNEESGELSGTPDSATTYNVIFLAEDASGCTANKAYSLTVTPGDAPVITFPELGEVVYGAANFAPGASSTNGEEINYTSSDETVAIVNPQGEIQILRAGITEITASLPTDPNFETAEPVMRGLTVNPASLLVTANDDSKTFDGTAYSGGNGTVVTGWQYADTDALLQGSPAYTGTSQGAVNVGDYVIIPSGYDALNNYDFNYQNGTLNIVPAGQVVINFPELDTKTYGDADFAPGATSSDDRQVEYSSSNENVALITAGGMIRIVGAGTADITAFLPEDGNFEDAETVKHTLTVNPASLTITANDDAQTYNGTAYSGGNGVTITGWVYDDTDALLQGNLTYTGNSQGATNVGTYEIIPAGYDALNNYTFDYISGTLTVTTAAYGNITFNDAEFVYDGMEHVLAITGELPEGTSVSYQNNSRTDVGTQTVMAQIDGGDNYEDMELTAELIVNPLAVTVVADNQQKVYGMGDPQLTYLADPLIGDDTFTGMLKREEGEAVGAYAITQGTLSAGDNYAITFEAGTLTITTADYENIVFNDAEFVYDGVEHTLAITGELPQGVSVTYQNNGRTDAGSQTVTALIDGGDNYEDMELTAELMVNPLAVMVSADDKGKVYGALDPELTYTTTTTLLDDDTFTGMLERNVGEAVGEYSITQGTLTAGDNYAITFEAGDLTISPATLTITAADDLKPYDGVAYNGGNGVTVTGWQYDDTDALLAGVLSYDGSSQGAIDAGQYQIIPSGYETLSNYVFNYQPGTLIITPAEEAVITFPPLDVVDLVYGDPAITPGAGSGDDRPVEYTSSDETVVIITPDGEIQIVGTGPVTITASLPDDPNYEDVPPVSQDLIIKPAILTVTANDDSKIYDGVAYTGGNGIVATGWKYDDTEALLEGTLSFSGSSQGAVNTGEYILVPDGYSAANYEIVYESGTLRIDKAPLVITAVDKTRKFGQENPEFTFNYQGFVSGEKEDDLTALPTAVTTATEVSPTGVYAITASGAASENYQISYVNGTLTIIPATRLLVFDALPEKTYEDADFDPEAEAHPEETILYSSSNTAVAEIVDGMVHITGAGKTVITATLAENPNYENRPSISRELIVHKAPQTIDFFLPGEVERDAGIIALEITTSSGLPVTLSSSDEQVAIVAGENQLEILRLGTSQVTATQGGNANYLAAQPVSRELKVVDLLGNLIKVHPVVSPNGDGINEFLLVEGIRDYPVNRMTVVNRNGVKVFQIENYDNSERVFRGLTNNSFSDRSLLPQGTYFYLLEIQTDNGWKRKTGWFVMKHSND